MNQFSRVFVFFLIFIGMFPVASFAKDQPESLTGNLKKLALKYKPINQARGGIIYTPAYSHTFVGEGNIQFNFTVTLSLRNTDPINPVSITSLDYYDSDGKLVKHCIEKEQILQPLASMKVLIKESDLAGGEGACFLINWQSENAVTQPLAETIMIATRQQQGISFSSRGITISTVD